MKGRIRTQDGHVFKAGRVLGAGKSRVVFELRGLPDFVIKIAHRTNAGEHNRDEWAHWKTASEDEKKWLCPCKAIYDNGIYLVQRRGEPVTKAQVAQALKRAPCWVKNRDDKKHQNFVMLDGRVVFCDYGKGKK